MTEQRGEKFDFNNGDFREASGSNRQQYANFNSSKLNSERIVSITNEEPIKTIWKNILRKHPLNQSDIRILVNSALVTMDYQSEVEELIKELGNPESGLERLREIINFPSMSCDAGLDDRVLSFQYVILPLLGLLTRIITTECNSKECAHAIFMAVYTNLDSFLYDNVMKMLETLVQRNSIVDNKVSVDELLSHGQHSFIPTSLGMFFLIIIRFLTELLYRIKEASINETMHKIVLDLQRLKTTYQQSFERQQSTSALTDPLINDLEISFMILEKEMNYTNGNPNSSSYLSEKDWKLQEEEEKRQREKELEEQEAEKASQAQEARERALAEDRQANLSNEEYDLPGELSKNGRRHDNDFEEISKISIIPTIEEILCDRPPFLPSTISDTPHFFEGVARLLDTQFRLLREDMLNPIRNSLSKFLTEISKDLSSSTKNDNLSELKKTGDKYKCNSGDLQVYVGVKFIRINCDRKKGLTCTIRIKFRGANNKLLAGNLVVLLLRNPHPMSYSDPYSLYFGVIISSNALVHRSEIDINFDPSIYPIALHEISNPDDVTKESLENRFLIESTSVYFEAYYHILKNLQTTDPSSFPFEKYLAPESDYLKMQKDKKGKSNEEARNSSSIDIKVENPKYTKESGFEFDLSVLCNGKNRESLKLNVADTNIHDLEMKITKYSIISKPGKSDEYGLDETQAKALVHALTREIALIEGPPGTGKTVIGVQVMKVLLANKARAKIGPILTICFTNHALDQFLEDLLDEEITNKIIRLGSRTKSEKIKKFNLEEICAQNRARNRARNRASYRSGDKRVLHETLEDIECEIDKVKSALSSFKKNMSWNDIKGYLMNEEREYYDKFIIEYDLPSWIFEEIEDDTQNKQGGLPRQSEGAQNKESNDVEEIGEEFSEEKEHEDEFEEEFEDEDVFEDEEFDEGFIEEICQTQNSLFSDIIDCAKEPLKPVRNKRKMSLFEQWLKGEDIRIIDKAKKLYQENSNDGGSQWIENYKEPIITRPLGILLKEYSIWQMSKVERRNLHDYWRTKINNQFKDELSYLQKMHDEKRQEMNEIYDEERRQVLLNSDVIGMTTNGAAKFQTLIKSIGPKIIICEEAGEVLEAHILSALTTSTQHLILIGDHNQLRPHIATYSLSIDSPMGNYQLDKSLFERLVHGDNAVKIEKAQLLTQRRMRKEISDLIRGTLYPNLIDGDNTAKYPNVRGVQHNVYFIDHKHPENSSDSELPAKSRVNNYEVEMVVEMVNYFVKNGYTKPEDIAVLTPYLGQMIKIKDALDQSFRVVIDERDAKDIAEMEETEKYVRNVSNKLKLNQQITLRTVDNFQGEEANIVIISLVRNFSGHGRHGSIGFLKSSNRSNVLLSRAREGMYLIGNSELMAARSEDMWAPVIDILKKRNQVGLGMPIVCNRHNYKNVITEPEQFAQVSPNGGCNQQCSELLSCGHACTRECRHSVDSNHIKNNCLEPCSKFHSECNHPCTKCCYQNCGRCNFLVGDIKLPDCEHTLQNAKCWQNKIKDKLECKTIVTKKLPSCGHSKDTYCHEPVDKVICRRQCSKILECYHECLEDCYGCPNHSTLRGRSINKHQSLCYFSVEDIKLPGCGHVFQNAKCWQNQNIMTLECMEIVTKKLPCCKHFKELRCFKSVDDVKCREKCGEVLECGHECLEECYDCPKHSLRGINKHYLHPSRCNFPVDIRLTDCGHVIKKAKCWQNQAQWTIKCMAQVTKKLSQCKHSQVLNCHVSVDNVKCIEKCGIILECGHECDHECFDCPEHFLQGRSINKHYPHQSRCNFTVDIKLSGCGHVIQNAECWQNQAQETLECMAQVTKTLSQCKHSKVLYCHESVDNVKCIERCGRILECGHKCLEECFDCSMHSLRGRSINKDHSKHCNFTVDIKLSGCGHVIQSVKCWQNQAQETLKCITSVIRKLPHCKHSTFLHCHESVDNVKCVERCGIILECGHECLNECFKCPKHSILQNESTDEERICDFPFGDITLPGCGHVLQNAKCWENQTKETVECMIQVTRELPYCEHSKLIHCYESVDNVKCIEKCGKTLKCGHECLNECFECPEHSTLQKGFTIEKKLPSICNFSVGDIVLPTCGHVFQNAKCCQTKETLKCMTKIIKKLPHCKHFKVFHCYESVDNVKCIENCGKTLECGHECLNKCFKCPKHSTLQNESIDEKKLPSTCNFPVGDIILPCCGHELQNAKCWENQTKETVECMVQVTRKLPHCEHSKLIHCYESIYDAECKEKCGKILECGHECLNECVRCKESFRKIKHGKCQNLCGKLLFCGHKCNQNCHEGTECPPFCKSKCMISCRHTIESCDKSCSEPCAVCAKKCLWECKHQGKCELNCGTPCCRLPCNERCDETLNCGHRCMGICGEICPRKEFCAICASKKVKNQVSDMINNIIFSKVNWYKERMIVLNCGHVYTMETMDMIMEMEDYYEGEGEWTSSKALPTSITSIKTCPACRTPIKDIKRYGRIIKKYILDAQIEKFRLKYDKQLKGIKKQIVFKETKNRRVQLKNYLPKLKFKEGFSFIPDHYFENIKKYRGFSHNEQVWINYIKKLLNHHRKLKEIICATESPPHKEAFDASALALHRAKLAILDPSESLELNFQEIQKVLSQAGISIPQIDRRIYLDTNFEIINIQKIIFDEILFIIQKISKESTSNDPINIKDGWSGLAESLQNSIQNNLNHMRKVAESYHYDKDLLLVNVETLEFDLETLKFQLTKTNEYSVQTKIMEKCGEIKKSIVDISRSDRYNTAETNFRSDIHKRLKNLYEYCDGV